MIKINSDETVALVDEDPLTDLIGACQVDEVNVLDALELYAVRASVLKHPYPLGNGEAIYRNFLKIAKEEADKMPSIPLGKLRHAILTTALGSNGGPSDSYLAIAAQIKLGKPVSVW